MYNYYIDQIKNKEKECKEMKKDNQKIERKKRKSNYISLLLVL